MKVILTPIPDANPRNTYVVVLRCMHGDADKYEDVTIKCKNEAQFISMMLARNTMPLYGSAGGDESVYREWCEQHFMDYVPRDCIYQDNLTLVDEVSGFKYDEHGIKLKAEVTP